ncbi:MAG: hypothetical protein PHN49_11695 [Candidatus Omnitrophica bacterium]|nr:hypothetical protein [Candidatus Omnitrophota bacterium]MDD5672291.1 hypothetical protein [Candidatus Omnitrophota bacterium]
MQKVSNRYLKGIRALLGSIVLFLWLFQSDTTAAQSIVDYPGIEPLEQSQAFKRYRMQPPSEYTKLIYLINRFSAADIEVIYDGYQYPTRFIAPFARQFLSRNYQRKQTAKDWILKWGNLTVPLGNLVWVKFPDGSVLLARDVLFRELESLALAAKQASETNGEKQIEIDRDRQSGSQTRTD